MRTSESALCFLGRASARGVAAGRNMLSNAKRFRPRQSYPSSGVVAVTRLMYSLLAIFSYPLQATSGRGSDD